MSALQPGDVAIQSSNGGWWWMIDWDPDPELEVRALIAVCVRPPAEIPGSDDFSLGDTCNFTSTPFDDGVELVEPDRVPADLWVEIAKWALTR